ncbi:MAG: hypothetical protein PHQ83_09455 [Eubacteriales bacterium]|nr:hypothetical protein [Eubacteriales bacterium]
MEWAWQRRLTILALALVLALAGYSLFFRTYLDADRYLAMALDATGNDPAIINADEPDFRVGLHKGRLTIHFIFQTEAPEGIGSISLYIDPFRKTYFDVEHQDTYTGMP